MIETPIMTIMVKALKSLNIIAVDYFLNEIT
jgi:hypothetical protein